MKLPKALLRRHWLALVECELAECEKVGAKVSRTTYTENLDAIWIKLFWVVYEKQHAGTCGAPPFIKNSVARRIWSDVRPDNIVIKYAAELSGIDEKRLTSWFCHDSHPVVSVFMFERLLLRLFDVNLFEMLDLHNDVILWNGPRSNEEKHGH